MAKVNINEANRNEFGGDRSLYESTYNVRTKQHQWIPREARDFVSKFEVGRGDLIFKDSPESEYHIGWIEYGETQTAIDEAMQMVQDGGSYAYAKDWNVRPSLAPFIRANSEGVLTFGGADKNTMALKVIPWERYQQLRDRELRLSNSVTGAGEKAMSSAASEINSKNRGSDYQIQKAEFTVEDGGVEIR